MPADKKAGWDKVSAIVQAISRLAIFASLVGLLIGTRRSNKRTRTNSPDVRDQLHQATLDRTSPTEKKSGLGKISAIIQATSGLAIFVSLAGLFIGIRQFNDQQTTNATDLMNQQHQTTLDKYLDDMSDLVLNHKLATSGPDSPITAIATARTATALRNLDGFRKGIDALQQALQPPE